MLSLNKCERMMKIREMKDHELDEIINNRMPKGQAKWKTYCQTLDAMHDAEKALKSMEQDAYLDYLGYMISSSVKLEDLISSTWNLPDFMVVHATARQKAEAFVLTVTEENK